MPTFNRGRRMLAAVDCVLAQTWRPLELVIVDDGSTDDTPAVLQELLPRVQAAGVQANFVRQDNTGVAAARNRALKESTGDWISFLDDDDRWTPDKTSAQMALVGKGGINGACAVSLIEQSDGGFDLVPERGQKLLQGFCPGDNIRMTRHAHLDTLLVARAAVLAAGEFDTRLKISSDIEWIMRLCHHVSWAALARAVHEYDRSNHAGALTHEPDDQAARRKDEIRARMIEYVREKCSAHPTWDQAAWQERVGLEYRAFVRHALKARRYRHAVELYRKGMQLSLEAEPLRRMATRMLKARLKAKFERKE